MVTPSYLRDSRSDEASLNSETLAFLLANPAAALATLSQTSPAAQLPRNLSHALHFDAATPSAGPSQQAVRHASRASAESFSHVATRTWVPQHTAINGGASGARSGVRMASSTSNSIVAAASALNHNSWRPVDAAVDQRAVDWAGCDVPALSHLLLLEQMRQTRQMEQAEQLRKAAADAARLGEATGGSSEHADYSGGGVGLAVAEQLDQLQREERLDECERRDARDCDLGTRGGATGEQRETGRYDQFERAARTDDTCPPHARPSPLLSLAPDFREFRAGGRGGGVFGDDRSAGAPAADHGRREEGASDLSDRDTPGGAAGIGGAALGSDDVAHAGDSTHRDPLGTAAAGQAPRGSRSKSVAQIPLVPIGWGHAPPAPVAEAWGGAQGRSEGEAERRRREQERVAFDWSEKGPRSHSEAEKRRRERINQQLGVLRALLPGASMGKADKASVLAEAVAQLRALRAGLGESCGEEGEGEDEREKGQQGSGKQEGAEEEAGEGQRAEVVGEEGAERAERAAGAAAGFVASSLLACGKVPEATPREDDAVEVHLVWAHVEEGERGDEVGEEVREDTEEQGEVDRKGGEGLAGRKRRRGSEGERAVCVCI
ncbi:unnamed protein product [Closterium sp. NIES-64]|nr:unnamed protein product [Closterium sp. NIES-64]